MSAFPVASLAAAVLAFAAPTFAQDAKPAAPVQTLAPIEQRIDTFITVLEERRKDLAVVGAAVVVAHGDRIVRTAGLGQRSLESPEPVTEDTVFALGSVTKQFTALAVALTVNDGKMTFEDHPRRFVPSFRLQDEEADAKLNMIDLLAHRSGLDRSDVAWLLAPFTQEELFALAYRAKPAAKLREQFLYNNAMYALAGAAVARAQQTTYERFVTERLLKPLGMSSSTLTLEGLTSSRNRAIGYSTSLAGKNEAAKPSDLAAIAPAGALNSTARDMGAWLRALNSRGRIGGETKIVQAAFARLLERHQPIGGGAYYGLGFICFVDPESGVLVAQHGGNVPGYTAHVVHVPERALSLAVLTNQTHSLLGPLAQNLFWEIVVKPEVAARPIPPDELAGQYFATYGGTFEVKKTESVLSAIFAGQPPYPLKATGANAFDLSGLNGFSLTFKESSEMPGRITVLLRQPPSHPGGNIRYLKTDDVWLARAKDGHSGPGKDLIGRYYTDDRTATMEIAPYKSGVALIVTNGAPALLSETEKDLYRLEGLPETHRVKLKRSSAGQIGGFTFIRPDGPLELRAAAGMGGVEEARSILDKAVAAAGGAEALDRIASMSAAGRTTAPTHGLDGRFEEHIVTGKRAAFFELGAFGKTVFKLRVVTTDRRSLYVLPDGSQLVETGKALAASRFFAVPHSLYRWKERFAAVKVLGEARVNGEDAVIVELAPKDLAPTKLSISTKSFLILREEVPTYVGDELQPTATIVDYSDYRAVSGVQLPFAASLPTPFLDRITLTYDSISLNRPIDPKVFDGPPP
ncbi:MAG: serine hydrolase [Hyphomicrobiaceae bacterium]